MCFSNWNRFLLSRCNLHEKQPVGSYFCKNVKSSFMIFSVDFKSLK